MAEGENAWATLGTEKVDATTAKKDFSIPIYSDEEIEKRINEFQSAQWGICGVFYGLDGTAKTGCAMDCRTPREVEEGQKIYVIDHDQNASPDKVEYHNNDPNIVLLDPVVIGDDGHEDPLGTYGMALSYSRYVYRKSRQEKVRMIIYDGIDSLLKTCELVMKIVDLQIDPLARAKDSFDWGYRNLKFGEIIMTLKRCNSDKIFITHCKEKKQWVEAIPGSKKKELQTVGVEPNWDSKFPDKMVQRVLFAKKNENGVIKITAKVKKCNSNIQLEGKEYVVATVGDGKYTWNGLREFYNEIHFNKKVK